MMTNVMSNLNSGSPTNLTYVHFPKQKIFASNYGYIYP